MREWIITGALYVLGMGIFGLLGGLASAGDALRNWGRTSCARRDHSSDVMS